MKVDAAGAATVATPVALQPHPITTCPPSSKLRSVWCGLRRLRRVR